MLEIFIFFGFLVAAAVLTGITWSGQNKKPRNLLALGFIVLGLGGVFGIVWTSALREPLTGPRSEIFFLIGLLGQLLSMYAAILASTLVRAAWSDRHSPTK